MSGSLRYGEGASARIVTADVPLPVAATTLPCTAGQTSHVTVGTSAVRLDSSPLAGRKSVEVRALNANGSERVYVGFSASVTTLTGRELLANEPVTFEIDEYLSIYGIATASAQGVCVVELGSSP